jgi:hypothetical protein
MAGLTAIPTRTTGSLGPTKVDEAAAADNVHSIAASDWNAAAAAIVAIAERLGINDGSQPGTLEDMILAASSDRFGFFDDFAALNSHAEGPWEILVSGTGSDDGITDAASAPASGFGWRKLSVGAGAGYAFLQSRQNLMVLSTHGPVELRARVKLPVTLASAVAAVSLSDVAYGSQVALQTTVGGAWEVYAISAAGGNDDTQAVTNVTPSAGGVVEIRMLLSDGAVSIYIDDVLCELAAPLASDAVPQGADPLAALLACTYAAGADSMSVDYVALTGTR